jgi:ankyrin repeat protein
VDARYDNGRTIMHDAASFGNETIARRLIDHGANFKVADKIQGRLPFHKAARRGNVNLLRLLFDKGCDPNMEDYDGYTALHYAAQDDRRLATHVLIGWGVGIDAKTLRGETPLSIAALFRHPAMVRLLINKGANLKAKNIDGESLLHAAVCLEDEVLSAPRHENVSTIARAWLDGEERRYEGSCPILQG